MLGSRFRLGLLAEHQQVLVYRRVRRELRPGFPKVPPPNDGLLGQRTKRCENIGLLQWSGHAAITLKRKNRLGKPGMVPGHLNTLAYGLCRPSRWSQPFAIGHLPSAGEAPPNPPEATSMRHQSHLKAC